jgi:hypothetical protein
MKRNARQVTSPTGRTGVTALLLAMHALTSSARAAMGVETDRPRQTDKSWYWPNPSSTEGGRPWPPAPGYW